MNKFSVVYFQSGGPTSVINASLYGFIKAAKEHPEIDGIYGSLYGIEGLIKDELADLRLEEDEQLELLLQTPGTALGSARFKIKDNQAEIFPKIEKTLQKHNIKAIFVNGGNDSMDTCFQLSQYFKGSDIRVLGVPKTVDNDLDFTDHCLGFGSSAKAVINDIKAISIDVSAYPKGKITLVEVMGRDTGWLTAASALIDEPYAPDYIYVPEMGFDVDAFLSQMEETYHKKQRVLVVASEAIPVARDDHANKDAFGHVYFEGVVNTLSSIIGERLHISNRAIVLSLPLRADPFNISKVDQDEAIEMSSFMVKKMLEGETGKVGCIKRLSSFPYQRQFYLEEASKIANAIQYMPADWIASFGKLKKEKVKEYVLPLIQGEVPITLKEGQLLSANLKLKRLD